jgi:hypothetical protein
MSNIIPVTREIADLEIKPAFLECNPDYWFSFRKSQHMVPNPNFDWEDPSKDDIIITKYYCRIFNDNQSHTLMNSKEIYDWLKLNDYFESFTNQMEYLKLKWEEETLLNV